MKERLVFATGNEGKMREIRKILDGLGMEILSMKEAGVSLDILEDGETFRENAQIKAYAVWRETCAIAAALPDGQVLHTEAAMEGLIAERPAGCGGFGYDPILYIPGSGKTSAELTMEEKNKISHRGKALEEMRARLAALYGGRA